MTSEVHLAALRRKHSGLEEKITLETQRPQPDTVLLSELKKTKTGYQRRNRKALRFCVSSAAAPPGGFFVPSHFLQLHPQELYQVGY